MKTAASKLDSHQGRKKMLSAVLAGIVLSFVLYSFAIASTTLSISETKTHNEDIQNLQTEIAELEVSYFDMINILSLDEAAEYGFKESLSVHYAQVDNTTTVAYNF